MLTVQLTIQYNAALLQNEKRVLQINGYHQNSPLLKKDQLQKKGNAESG